MAEVEGSRGDDRVIAAVSEEAHAEPDAMDWEMYAEAYDGVCEDNPSYQDILDRLVQRVSSWDLGVTPRICDVGAGTGNFVVRLAQIFPDAEITHLDMDQAMNDRAVEKYARENVTNVTITQQLVQRAQFAEQSFDLIVCVNALYAMEARPIVLQRLKRWLSVGGILFIVDFGRRHSILDWGVYMFRNMVKKYGFVGYVRRSIANFEAVKQNNRLGKGQDSGRYWTHSTIEFGGILRETGFEVRELQSCYRGYADMAVCTRTGN